MGYEFPNTYANPLRHFVGGNNGTPGALTSLIFANTLWVAENGTVGVREDASKPFPSLTAALSAAQAGDSIYVFPGNYAELAVAAAVPVKIYFLGAVLTGQIYAQADIELYSPIIVNNTLAEACVRIDTTGVTAKIFGGELSSIQNGIGYSLGVTDFTYQLDGVKIMSDDSSIQLSGILTAHNVKLKAKGCTIESLQYALELDQAQFDVSDCTLSNKNSLVAIAPVDFLSRGIAGLTGTIRACYIIGSATSTFAISSNSLFAGETVNVSNCQSNRSFPAGVGYVVNNALVETSLTTI